MSSQRAEKRRAAQLVQQAKLDAAYSRIRELELRCLANEELDPVNQEVRARFAMAQPALTRLVAAGQNSLDELAVVPGDLKACRNYGMHCELGCGAGNLPRSAAEAKQRGRGGRRRAVIAAGADSDPGPQLDMVSQGSSEASDRNPDCFQQRFQEALAIVNITRDRKLQGAGLAPGTWISSETSPVPSTLLNPNAAPFFPGSTLAGDESPRLPSLSEDEAFYSLLKAEIALESDAACDKAEICLTEASDTASQEHSSTCALSERVDSMQKDLRQSESLILTLADQIEELKHSLALRCESITADVATCGNKLGADLAMHMASQQQTQHGVIRKLDELTVAVRYCTEAENLRGLPDMLMGLADQLKLSATSSAKAPCDKAVIVANHRGIQTDTLVACQKDTPAHAEVQARYSSRDASTQTAFTSIDASAQVASAFFEAATQTLDSSMTSHARSPCHTISYNSAINSNGVKPRWTDLASDEDGCFNADPQAQTSPDAAAAACCLLPAAARRGLFCADATQSTSMIAQTSVAWEELVKEACEKGPSHEMSSKEPKQPAGNRKESPPHHPVHHFVSSSSSLGTGAGRLHNNMQHETKTHPKQLHVTLDENPAGTALGKGTQGDRETVSSTGKDCNPEALLETSLEALAHKIRGLQSESKILDGYWRVYCDNLGGGLYDPLRHTPRFINEWLQKPTIMKCRMELEQ
eukprot:TRINITY_DN28845_c0_g1_i2.p1 TRINITY_DN28845_c0_g1~~TRINITY_DN28845_c0_g1_i2.p1  ORF type:complete len:700 (+),score=143.77 TRINITY_DN28845_c0_g1_i2:95-2194(+)